MSRVVSLGATCLALILSPASASASRVAELDPDSTRITFRLSTTLHTVEGTFRLRSGRIEFDPEGGTATGRIVVDARSGESGSGLRDRRMHKEVLESERYPEIVLVPQQLRVEPLDDASAKLGLSGALNIHGAEHPIAIGGSVRVDGSRAHLHASFVVPYVDWGMKSMSSFLLRVEPAVSIDIDADVALVEP
jgi:polyisoprenoid-binding protein YceI